MNKLQNIIRKIRIRIKMCFFRALHPNAMITISGTPNIANFSEIEVGYQSTLNVGSSFSMRKNVLLAVRNNAKLSIGSGVFINKNTIITARQCIIIGDGVTIGPNVCIYDHDHNIYDVGEYVLDSVTIKENVWIGANVIVLKGVTIGENSVISAGSVVTKNVPSNTILIQKRNNTLIHK